MQSASIRRRARILLVFSLFTAISAGMAATAKAQTFAEWFDQKNTQKKYLLQQIAALALYADYLKQGYHIASGGFNSISGSLRTEYGLHKTYYDRLNAVSPAVKNNPEVNEILTWQQDILNRLGKIDQISGFTTAERNYLINVRSALFLDCDDQINILQSVINDRKLKMSDAERITLISKLHAAMLSNYRFASGFMLQVNLYAAQREQEKQQTMITRQYYGIKQ
jgi:hypothetical protein